MSTEEYTPINIKALAKTTVPALAPFIPGFVYRILEKILHIKELNSCFAAHYNDSSADFLAGVEEVLGNTIVFDGPGVSFMQENKEKNILFAGNHPYGGPEAMALMNHLIHLYPDIKLVAQSFLSFIKPLHSCCVYNKKDVRTLMNHVEQQNPLLIYPSGKCSRKLSTKDIFDNVWFPSFVKIAKRNRMKIVIVYTDGQLSKRFFRWQRIEGKTGFATVFLVDEMFRMAGKQLRMVVSEPIDYSVLTDDIPNSEWALRLRQFCFRLRKDPFAVFNPSEPNFLPVN